MRYLPIASAHRSTNNVPSVSVEGRVVLGRRLEVKLLHYSIHICDTLEGFSVSDDLKGQRPGSELSMHKFTQFPVSVGRERNGPSGHS